MIWFLVVVYIAMLLAVCFVGLVFWFYVCYYFVWTCCFVTVLLMIIVLLDSWRFLVVWICVLIAFDFICLIVLDIRFLTAIGVFNSVALLRMFLCILHFAGW